ncbi:MAG: prepilin-type N-terminal cleavage/methylation domain-containing protein [Thermodesulfobacteriota bacterium]
MRTSIPGKTHSGGFTLVELSVVLFVLGLILWTVAPRLSQFGERSRDAVFRDLASGSEEAFDISLFEKRETRLVILPSEGKYEFRIVDRPEAQRRPREFGSRLSVTGIRIEGEERPLDIPTEIRFLPGGRVPATWIHIREADDDREVARWTLRLNPWDGSMKVLEGTVTGDG